MASAAVKLAVVSMLVISFGQLMTLSSASRVDDGAGKAVLLRLQELEEVVPAEELALLDDGGDAVDATVCSSNCQKCLVKCAVPCFLMPSSFVTCFIKCAVSKKCFSL